MIRNLVFDYGGVIVDLNSDETRKALRQLGISPLRQFLHRKEILRLMNQLIDGLVPTQQTLAEMLPLCRKNTKEDDLLQVLRRLTGNLPIKRVQQLKELRKQYKVYMLSNINDILWEITENQFHQMGFQVEDCFDEVFLSYRMQLAKPDKRIYEELIRATGIKPEETLYFDDRADNVEAGSKCKFHAVHVKTNHLEKVKEFTSLFQ